MPNLGPFPSKEADLNQYFQTAVSYLGANATRLLISNANKTAMNASLSEWNAIFPGSQNLNTRTKTIVQQKDQARAALMDVIRRIYNDVPESVWTIEDRNTLNIASRSTAKTPVPVPTAKPVAQVNTSRRLEHTISFKNEDGAAKPEGARGCQIWHSVGIAATDPKQLSYLATDTASPYTHQFDGEQAGKPVYYWLRWENSRGETGPWSDVVMATVTG